MLLVTFHGGKSPGINNVFCYNTTTKALLSDQALYHIDSDQLSELRAGLPQRLSLPGQRWQEYVAMC